MSEEGAHRDGIQYPSAHSNNTPYLEAYRCLEQTVHRTTPEGRRLTARTMGTLGLEYPSQCNAQGKFG
jgi:hypothetical protein